MGEKVIDIKCVAERREITEKLGAIGWTLRWSGTPDGPLKGPRIYLCDVESQQLHLVQLIEDGIRKSIKQMDKAGFTFEDACDFLGTILDDLAAGQVKLDSATQGALSLAAARYVGGTKTYTLAKDRPETWQQFIVIRYSDVSRNEKLLRPAVCIGPTPLSPQELEGFVDQVLAADRLAHPERFPRAQILTFRPKSS